MTLRTMWRRKSTIALACLVQGDVCLLANVHLFMDAEFIKGVWFLLQFSSNAIVFPVRKSQVHLATSVATQRGVDTSFK